MKFISILVKANISLTIWYQTDGKLLYNVIYNTLVLSSSENNFTMVNLASVRYEIDQQYEVVQYVCCAFPLAFVEARQSIHLHTQQRLCHCNTYCCLSCATHAPVEVGGRITLWRGSVTSRVSWERSAISPVTDGPPWPTYLTYVPLIKEMRLERCVYVM